MDAVLFQDLYPRNDADDTQLEIDLADLAVDDDEDHLYYAEFELRSVELEHNSTTRFERPHDTSHDHVETVKFPLEPIQMIETRPVRRVALGSVAAPLASLAPIHSTPYAKVDITPSFENALPFPVESLPFERVELDVIDPPRRPRQQTEIIDRGMSMVTVVAVMITLMALSVATVLLLMR